MPEAQGHQQPAYFAGRGGGPRPRGHMNGNGHAYGAIDEKLAGLQIRDVRRLFRCVRLSLTEISGAAFSCSKWHRELE